MPNMFDNKVFIEPSTGARVVSAYPPTPIQLGSGNLAILAESNGGLTVEDGKVYEYSSAQAGELEKILRKGSVGARMCEYAFAPSNQYPGAQKIFFVRTQVATGASATITNSTKTFVMASADKGSYLSDATNGLMWKVIAGIVDSNKRILQLKLDGQIIWQSPETANTFADMKLAVEADATIYPNVIKTVTVSDGAGTFATTSSFEVFTGGSQTSMASGDVDDALDLIRTREVDVVYMGSENSTYHAKAVAHCLNDAETPRISVFGGAVGETLAQVCARGVALNSHKGVLCYPGIKVPNTAGSAIETLSPMYTASMVAGLIAGLPPQVPATYKPLAVQGFEINTTDGELVKDEREQLITNGVTFCRFISGLGYVINKAVTTTLKNTQMINSPDGSSREVSIERIKNQLNKELQIGARQLFIGGNLNTVGKQDVINYVKGYLTNKTATPTTDNLILGFTSVSAKLVDDAWYADYGFYANTPVNQMFFTGAILKPNL